MTAGRVMLQGCAFADLRPHQSAAARERVSLKDTPDTRWYWIVPFGEWEPVGFAGLYFRNGVGRIKGVLVFKSQRGRGYGEAAVAMLEATAAEYGCSAVEAFAWNRAFYEARGYTCTGTNAHGAYRVIKRL